MGFPTGRAVPLQAAILLGQSQSGERPEFVTSWRFLRKREAARDWDVLLSSFPDTTIFQSYEWGELHRRDGWAPYHGVAVDESRVPVAMFLGLARKYWNAAVIESYGGPIGDLSAYGEGLRDSIATSLGVSRVRPYCVHPFVFEP